MTDLEITKLCAEAMGLDWTEAVQHIWDMSPPHKEDPYDPLHDDAQAMALVKRFGLNIWFNEHSWPWRVVGGAHDEGDVWNTDLNRAICECVAKMQAAKARAVA